MTKINLPLFAIRVYRTTGGTRNTLPGLEDGQLSRAGRKHIKCHRCGARGHNSRFHTLADGWARCPKCENSGKILGGLNTGLTHRGKSERS